MTWTGKRMNSGRKTIISMIPLSFEGQMGWNLYSIPMAITIIILSNGFFIGYHGLNGDFGLDYCIDADSDTPFLGFSFNTRTATSLSARAVLKRGSSGQISCPSAY